MDWKEEFSKRVLLDGGAVADIDGWRDVYIITAEKLEEFITTVIAEILKSKPIPLVPTTAAKEEVKDLVLSAIQENVNPYPVYVEASIELLNTDEEMINLTLIPYYTVQALAIFSALLDGANYAEDGIYGLSNCDEGAVSDALYQCLLRVLGCNKFESWWSDVDKVTVLLGILLCGDVTFEGFKEMTTEKDKKELGLCFKLS